MNLDLENKKFTVIGLGRSGIAAAHFLHERGARVTILEQRPQSAFPRPRPALDPAIDVRFGSDALPEDTEAVILSPGVDIEAPFLDPARQRGIPLWSEIELASRFTACPIIAVTGTNGKSTCCTLIAEILRAAGKTARLGGNIGTPAVSLVNEGPADYAVLEISSFQLEAVETFKPWISVVLNVTPDHLDRHKTIDRYSELKGRIAMNQTAQDYMILNHDEPRTRSLGAGKPVRQVHFSPTAELQSGAFLRQGELWVRWAGDEYAICGVRELARTMQWQLENILAATAAVTVAGIDAAPLAETLKSFKGMAHRMEWVRTVEGVDYINDSKGTNVGAVQKSLSVFDRPVILIAGGKDKATDFLPLKPVLKRKVKHLILIGETRRKFRETLNGSFSYEEADSLETAVHQAMTKAQAGDVVLLSPACASFDMFKSYEERGDKFKSLVKQL